MKQANSDLAPFFTPKSVAIFGSFKEGYFAGYPAIKQLMDFGFSGKIYPVNPRYTEVLGHKVYPSVNEVPDVIDLAFIMTNASAVPQIMTECAEKGVKSAILVSDGFAERGEEGARLQRTVVDIARRGGVRIIGPNTAGIMSPVDNMICCAYFCGYDKVPKGTIALVSQTGIIAPEALPWHEFHCGINKLIGACCINPFHDISSMLR